MNTPVAPAAIMKKVLEDPHAIHRVYEEYALKSPMAQLYVHYEPGKGDRLGTVSLVGDIFDATYKSEIPPELWKDLAKSNTVVLIEGCAMQITTEMPDADSDN